MATKFKACSVDGCNKPRCNSRGWCAAHYARWRKYDDPLRRVRTPKGEPQKFLDFAVSHKGEDCLTWPFGRNNHGYGVIHGKYVHRLICERVKGFPSFPKAEAAHSCGNGHLGCVNPNHLSWKSRKRNMEDMVFHGRSQRGNRQWSTKLAPESVSAIRDLRGKLSQGQIGEMFGVDGETIGNIHRRETWAWLVE